MSININKKKEVLRNIEIQRCFLEQELLSGEINDEDILSLVNVESGYGFLKPKTYKETILKKIYNAPFILCDQKHIGIDVKKILPAFLLVMFDAQINELNYFYEQGQYSKEEYEKYKELLEFVYYKSSKDGKNILKTGNAVGIIDNIKVCR